MAFLRRLRNRIRYHAGEAIRRAGWVPATSPRDFGPGFADLYVRCAPFTMTPVERMGALYEAMQYLARARVPGAIVECGVWRGGSMMLAAFTALAQGEGEAERGFYLFDTFSGMTEPGPEDGTVVHAQWLKHQQRGGWARSPLEEVRHNMLSTGLGSGQFKLVEGRVEDTIPAGAPDRIALLRLDTDWYASTRHELVHLYPRLAPGGVLIIDDYGHFEGARRAVDEYLADCGEHLLFMRTDYDCRLAVKPGQLDPGPSPSGDAFARRSGGVGTAR
jgi:O-methyltransferase